MSKRKAKRPRSTELNQRQKEIVERHELRRKYRNVMENGTPDKREKDDVKKAVIVNDQLQKFWLATEDGWVDAVGHALHLDDIHLCVVAYDNKINVSEVTTGMRVAEKELNFTDLLNLQEKEDVMAYYNKIGRQISQQFAGKLPAIKQRIDERRKVTHTRLGTPPPIEDVDMEE